MKIKRTEFFYGTGPGLVRVSDRVYQPVDLGGLLKRDHLGLEFPVWLKKVIQVGSLLLAGFLVGGFCGEFLVNNYFSLYQSLSLPESLRIILLTGGLGVVLSGAVGLLSLVPVPE